LKSITAENVFARDDTSSVKQIKRKEKSFIKSENGEVVVAAEKHRSFSIFFF
jgi:hypothetical protein